MVAPFVIAIITISSIIGLFLFPPTNQQITNAIAQYQNPELSQPQLQGIPLLDDNIGLSGNVDNAFEGIGSYIKTYIDTTSHDDIEKELASNAIDSSVDAGISGKNLFVNLHEAVVNGILYGTYKNNVPVEHDVIVIAAMVITGLIATLVVWRVLKASGIVLILLIIAILVIWGAGIGLYLRI